MLDALRRPASAPLLIGAVAATGLLVALYCMAYTSLAGRPETLAQSLGWALANICPWLVAAEIAKRSRRTLEIAALLSLALTASIALGYLLGVSEDALAFEAMRRVPAMIAAASMVALIRSAVGHRSPREALPLLPRQIDWVRAAGNYVELRGGGRTVFHRSPIGSVEQSLAPHGFIRIHRSTLVRRDRIARVRPQDVILRDGTHLKVGNRYRAALPENSSLRPAALAKA